MTATVNQILATGSLLLVAAVVVVATTRPDWVRLRRIPLSLGMASLATAGSLFYSEVAGFVPCPLCWWQRIFMYPLVIVLAAAWAFRLRVRPIVLIQASLGLGVSGYHYLLQHFPSWSGEACSLEAPCSAAWVWEYGFVSIPFMAGVSFLVLIVLNSLKEPTT